MKTFRYGNDDGDDDGKWPYSKIGQFYVVTPEGATERTKGERGVYGWGFEEDGFRFVIFTPTKADHESLVGLEPDSQLRLKKRADHAPAHLHVIHMGSKRETRFELFDHEDGTFSVEPYYPNHKIDPTKTKLDIAKPDAGKPDEKPEEEKHDERKASGNSLDAAQIGKVREILEPRIIKNFIQVWREAYSFPPPKPKEDEPKTDSSETRDAKNQPRPDSDLHYQRVSGMVTRREKDGTIERWTEDGSWLLRIRNGKVVGQELVYPRENNNQPDQPDSPNDAVSKKSGATKTKKNDDTRGPQGK